MPARDSGLDTLRSLAALAVVLLHLTADPLLESCCDGGLLLVYVAAHVAARFAVPSFMVLSGAGITLASKREKPGYLSFIGRRFSKVLPPYVGWSLLYTFWLAPSLASLSWHKVLSDLFYGQATYHLYFVPLLVRLYLIYPVLLWLSQRPLRAGLFCLVAWTRGAWLSYFPQPALEWFVVDFIPLSWAGYFVLGIWVARQTMPNDSSATGAESTHEARANFPWLRRSLALAPWACSVLLILMITVTFRVATARKDIEVGLDTMEPLLWPYTLTVVATVLGWRTSDGKTHRLSRFLSAESYGIYLCHPFALDLVSRALAPFGYAPSSPSYVPLGLLLGVPLAVLLSMFTGRVGKALRELALLAPAQA